eukprot:815372-Rhodomonas_salina.3
MSGWPVVKDGAEKLAIQYPPLPLPPPRPPPLLLPPHPSPALRPQLAPPDAEASGGAQVQGGARGGAAAGTKPPGGESHRVQLQ